MEYLNKLSKSDITSYGLSITIGAIAGLAICKLI